jgi:hypothetical protein
VISGCGKDISRERVSFSFRIKAAYLRTKMTMIVMMAAKNTNPPKELRAMMELTLNLAP